MITGFWDIFFFLILDVFGGRSKEENGEYRCVEQKKK